MTDNTKIKFFDHKKVRSGLGLNQTDYWKNIRINQSSGCRYEAGDNIPYHVNAIAYLVYASEKEALDALAKMRGVIVDNVIAKRKAIVEE